MDALVKSAGSSDEAVRLLIADKLEAIVAEQVKAIAGVKIDKVTVWDNGASSDGKTATAGFFERALEEPAAPLEDIYRMAGLEMPELVAPKKIGEAEQAGESPAAQGNAAEDHAAPEA